MEATHPDEDQDGVNLHIFDNLILLKQRPQFVKSGEKSKKLSIKVSMCD